ncbi:MAG: DUF4129 domain-containing protein [Thermoplasmata archaeon]
MTRRRGRTFSNPLRWAGALSAVALLLLSGMSMNASAGDEIPHENFDLVGENLDVVVSLLRSSIAYSERALMAMYNRSMSSVEQNLSVVRSILIPADRILDDIEDVASSYENLSKLLPPFVALSGRMDSFSVMESQLLAALKKIVSASVLENLTGEDKLEALAAIRQVNLLITRMNSTIDGMLVDARDITALTVEGKTPFADNRLIPLIEKLRELLRIVLAQMEEIIHNEVPWGETEPFLLLWLDDDRYYLGEVIRGGGYLYFNGSFASNHLVDVLLDGELLISSTTNILGEFRFTYQIPVNASWLGTHVVRARASTAWETIWSDSLTITISLIPTSLKLTASTTLMSIEDRLVLSMTLREVHGLPMAGSVIRVESGGEIMEFTTDSLGTCSYSVNGRDLGYGRFSFQAYYDGVLPYASSSSALVSVVVDIPTSVDLVIFADRLRAGMYLVGSGVLLANGSTPLPQQTVTLLVDGVELLNVTTREDGSFAYTIETEDIPAGGHTLKAAFLYRDAVWRYCEDEESFTIYTLKPGEYPFWPHIPGWGGMFPVEEFPYLFFGKYAYITWLLIIVLIGLLVRLLQMRSARKAAAEKKALTAMLEPLEKTEAGPTQAATAADFAAELASKAAEPSTPNERIIWYYRALLNFLSNRRRIGLRESMTHWEVARFLRMLGYPQTAVERVTILFERALYSGAQLTEADTVMMSSNLTLIVSKGGTPGAA